MNKRNAAVVGYGVCLAIALAIMHVPNSFDDHMRYLLMPYAKSVELFYSLNGLVYEPGIGYVGLDSSYVIGSECMGAYYIAIMFIISTVPFLAHKRAVIIGIWILIGLVGSVAIGLIVNCMRIICSIPYVSHEKFNMIHLALGVALNLAALIPVYNLLRKLDNYIISEKKGG